MEILTDQGFKPFSSIVCNGIKDTITLQLSNGKQISCTEDHKFLMTNDVWVEAGDITKGAMFSTGVFLVDVVKNNKRQNVYDVVGIADTSSFYTSGVIAHNCDLLYVDECHPENTQITLWDKTKKPIQDLRIGERLLTWNEERNTFVIKKVTNLKMTGIKPVYEYKTVSGKTLRCTDNHPVWTREGWKPISEAKELATTKVKKGKYFFETIDEVKYLGDEEVYNLTVADTHTYIADDFIVHNCDFLDASAFNAILGLLMDNKHTEFWASSTPMGEGILYKLSKDPAYKEFYFPSYVIPHYTDEQDIEFRRNSTEAGYIQEVLGLFAISNDNVFPLEFIKKSTLPASEGVMVTAEYVIQKRDDFIVIIGVDWNSEKVGTRIITVAMHKMTGRHFIVQQDRVGVIGWNSQAAMEKVVDVNRKFSADHVYVDEGYGAAQVSILRQFSQQQYGKVPGNHPDLRLTDTVAVNFGSSTTLRDPVTGEEFKKNTKQLIVENTVDFLRRGVLIFHEKEDNDIIAQLKNYAIKTISPNGAKTYKYMNQQIADHDLDAYMLALYGFHKEYSVYSAFSAVGSIGTLIGGLSTDEMYEQQGVNETPVVSSASSNLIMHTRQYIVQNKFNNKNRRSSFKGRRRW